MGNFSEFINNNRNNLTEEQRVNYSNEDLEEMIDRYSQFSDDKLISEFMKLTIEKKKRGELTDSDLHNLKSTLYPLLDESQRNSLFQILEMVKNVK